MAGVEEKIALVTGAGRGIGRGTAKILAARGARVMGVSRTEEELASLGLDYVAADLGTLEGCTHAVEETAERLGPIDILVCNHGVGSADERVACPGRRSSQASSTPVAAISTRVLRGLRPWCRHRVGRDGRRGPSRCAIRSLAHENQAFEA